MHRETCWSLKRRTRVSQREREREIFSFLRSDYAGLSQSLSPSPIFPTSFLPSFIPPSHILARGHSRTGQHNPITVTALCFVTFPPPPPQPTVAFSKCWHSYFLFIICVCLCFPGRSGVRPQRSRIPWQGGSTFKHGVPNTFPGGNFPIFTETQNTSSLTHTYPL